jgi:activator of HSP90 ATPase
MLETIQLSATLPASPEQIYRDWLSSTGHTAFTGSPAEVDPAIGGRFTAWDGYIEGTNIELEPYRRILQAWRTSEFPTGSPDSRLEVLLEAVEGGTRLTINHSHIPEGQGAMYAQGWQDFYFTPMRAYYLSL